MGASTPEQIQADMERQREHLGQAVDELSRQLEAKARHGAKVGAVVGGVALVGLVVVLLWRRRS